ncbi:transaldolase [Candidatus Woesearchaeota archaeon]|nr:transaldolase [Candidatus Woesearchaeota archaeon]
MKIFIDTAKLSEIEEAYSLGVLDGVTTNPSLIKKAVTEDINMPDYIKKILKTAKATPVSLEVTETSYEKMVDQAKALYKMFNPVANNVVIKIPVSTSFEKSNFDGIKAVKALSKARIPVNCTLIFTPEQALMAAKAGAKFVSPFAGRVDDYIRTMNNIGFEKSDYFPSFGWRTDRLLEDNGIISGIDLVKQIAGIFRNYKIKSQVIAASLRNARQAREAALVGADIATLPLYVIKDMLKHYKTQEGMKKFTEDVVDEYANLVK